jgi:hypothetical protein
MESKATRYRTTAQASAYFCDRWGISRMPQTLAKIRCTRDDGPEFVRDGHRILYSEAALDEYAERVISAPRRSTKDPEQVAA